jgi:hypothetical protein
VPDAIVRLGPTSSALRTDVAAGSISGADAQIASHLAALIEEVDLPRNRRAARAPALAEDAPFYGASEIAARCA